MESQHAFLVVEKRLEVRLSFVQVRALYLFINVRVCPIFHRKDQQLAVVGISLNGCFMGNKTNNTSMVAAKKNVVSSVHRSDTTTTS